MICHDARFFLRLKTKFWNFSETLLPNGFTAKSFPTLYKKLQRTVSSLFIAHIHFHIHIHITSSMDPKSKSKSKPKPKPRTIVVMVPLVAQGHLNQLLHLARRIAAHDIPVHYASTATHVRQAKNRVHCWDPAASANLYFHDVRSPGISNIQPDPNSGNKFPSQLIPLFKSAIKDLREPVYELVQALSEGAERTVVVYDSMMAYTVQDVAALPNVEAYCFQSISAFSLYAFYWEVTGKPDVPEEAAAIKLTPSSEGAFVPEFAEISSLLIATPKFQAGEIYNTSRVIEGTYLDLLHKGKITGADKQWAMGPFHPLLLKQNTDSKSNNKCLQWLDEQGADSVIYVSFGSTVSLSNTEIAELAEGLARSEQKFLWVLRDADKADIYDGEVRRVQLPEGFEERVAGRGFIVRDWAPQLEILGHESTGGFMSHCGWNSCIESISMGVPIAAWPMHSDQPRNSVLITEVLKIGLEVRGWDRREEVVSSEMVEQTVRRLMASKEGDMLRQRAADIGKAVRKSVMEDGVGRKELASFIQHITR
ncbi:zeatin O-xylosyltransferase-like [Andrographis paniculata]|uniref:zeatin O-xylosyltransferase-like n=1 Tax=Andrographis paniculata TaxID=175694 RepID=UPI0021E80FA3|nr:zeatin O-xylosyltransferase-like [Andrographis paniculata]